MELDNICPSDYKDDSSSEMRGSVSEKGAFTEVARRMGVGPGVEGRSARRHTVGAKRKSSAVKGSAGTDEEQGENFRPASARTGGRSRGRLRVGLEFEPPSCPV